MFVYFGASSDFGVKVIEVVNLDFAGQRCASVMGKKRRRMCK